MACSAQQDTERRYIASPRVVSRNDPASLFAPSLIGIQLFVCQAASLDYPMANDPPVILNYVLHCFVNPSATNECIVRRR